MSHDAPDSLSLDTYPSVPSVVASQARRAVEDFVRTTFPTDAEPWFETTWDEFLGKSNQLFRGPFYSLKLPFKPGEKQGDFFPDVPTSFPPYLHQERAFERLASEPPLSTLIATGTGSGKTESYMIPILDWCRRDRTRRGIKAIIVYPMNALANDQAKRFAKTIYDNPNLRGLRVGLFVGGLDETKATALMSEDSVVTSREAQRETPPDILLTNYKMLDYMLTRPKDYPIWRFNEPGVLRYVVVDELHTFDGAQGVDLACLLRRVLARAKTSKKDVCFVGSSATLGDGADEKKRTLDFASCLFGKTFDSDALIGEQTLEPGDLIGNRLTVWGRDVEAADAIACGWAFCDGKVDYLRKQVELWFGDDFALSEEPDEEERVELGEQLLTLAFFQNLIKTLAGNTLDVDELARAMKRSIARFDWKNAEAVAALFDGAFALLGFARRRVVKSDGTVQTAPFLNVRVQLWMHELTQAVASVERNPRIRRAYELSPNEGVRFLPLAHCRACGRIAYAAWISEQRRRVSGDVRKIYNEFFRGKNSTKLHYLYVDDEENLDDEEKRKREKICGRCLTILRRDATECPCCRAKHDENSENDSFVNIVDEGVGEDGNGCCPRCGAQELALVGARLASLTSVAIARLFSSAFNDGAVGERKLLAFSDSVQDASHRAGFFSARTYGFNFRSALQKYVDSHRESPTLSETPQGFVDFWLKKLGSRAKFVEQFIPPDLTVDRPAYDAVFEQNVDASDAAFLTKNKENIDRLFDLTERRVHWEILKEYGFAARIGRTLEKSNCSIPTLRPEIRDAWADKAARRLTPEFGVFQRLGETAVRNLLTRTILRVVRTMRVEGAIYADFLAEYMRTGSAFQLGRLPFMPNFSEKRAPVFVAKSRALNRRFRTLKTLNDVLNDEVKDAYDALDRLELSSATESDWTEILEKLFEVGTELGALRCEKIARDVVWGLNPDVFIVETKVAQIKDKRGRLLPISESELAIFNVEAVEGGESRRYYRDLYRNGMMRRVVAREHTGLLEREERENLEKAFIAGRSLAAPNLLSCTPTLEMGIDIGTLSSAILCSVPPGRANYVQRIGRAGRKDGVAFNLVVASGLAHDSHFFAEPREMVCGEIVPPGIFLKAPAVLERQLIACCFDRWIEALDGETRAIPKNLKAVLDVISTSNEKTSAFPFNFLQYVELQRTEIFDSFREIFQEDFGDDEESVEYLRAFMSDKNEGTLEWKILRPLMSLAQERKTLTSKIKTVHERLKRLESGERDEYVDGQIAALKNEKAYLQDRVKETNQKDVFNFFTDEGLLPNYAFPETGVKLRSVIYRDRKGNEERVAFKARSTVEEYERPGNTAIQEFAPGAVFYVGGRKLTINQIDASPENRETWRFCGNCDHMEKIDPTIPTVPNPCPKCGSATWADGSLTRDVVRLKQVISALSEKNSRAFDADERREPVFFNAHMIVDYDAENVKRAFKAPESETLWGVEYLRKATFREINFGRADAELEVEIGGRKTPEKGFRVCKKCGRVFDETKGRIEHRPYCDYFLKEKKKQNEIELDCFYLYREFESEAIRMLTPLGEMDVEELQPSIIAAFLTGLKEYFHGAVDHLQVAVVEEPVADSHVKKRIITIYDQIPGGTGYLKELLKTPDRFFDMLQMARDKLKNCECAKDEEKNGCYRCIYTRRMNRDLSKIKRTEALAFLQSVLAMRDRLKEVTALSEIPVFGLFESELEKRFIEALRRVEYKNAEGQTVRAELKKQVVGGVPGYLYQIGDRVYEIFQQYDIGENEGVERPSRADFLIRSTRQSQDNFKPIAVFTDGFEYHGDILSKKSEYSFHQDLLKRWTISRSGRLRCWSISYDDVKRKFDETAGGYSDDDSPFLRCRPAEMLLRQGKAQERSWARLPETNSFDSLIRFLSAPEEATAGDWEDVAFNFAHELAFAPDGKKVGTELSAARETVEKLLSTIAYRNYEASVEELTRRKTTANGAFFASTFYVGPIRCDAALARDKKGDDVAFIFRINDEDLVLTDRQEFKQVWNYALRALNVLQFLPGAALVTTRFVREGFAVPEAASSQNDECDELSDAFPEVEGILTIVRQNGWPFPSVGWELDVDGEVRGAAELAWPQRKIAVLTEPDDRDAFVADGWRIVEVDEENDGVSAFVEMFNNEAQMEITQ